MRWQLLPDRTEVTCGETLPFLLINDGSGLISFGLSYRLERYDRDAWFECDFEGASQRFRSDGPGSGLSLPPTFLPMLLRVDIACFAGGVGSISDRAPLNVLPPHPTANDRVPTAQSVPMQSKALRVIYETYVLFARRVPLYACRPSRRNLSGCSPLRGLHGTRGQSVVINMVALLAMRWRWAVRLESLVGVPWVRRGRATRAVLGSSRACSRPRVARRRRARADRRRCR